MVGKSEPIVIIPSIKMLNFKTLEADSFAFQTWHYPNINEIERPYQQRIIETSLLHNSLVCLPTGLGKTFIGLVVMYNFHRWFPSRKVIFLAPTRPLVNQQYKAWLKQFSKTFHTSAIELTGNLNPEKRHYAWNNNSVFFSTPQILENDIENNLCDPESIVCLIIDEAHHAIGNYSYCNIIRKLVDLEIDFRVCGLTATPGTTLQSIQALIEILKIEALEYLNERSPELLPFISTKSREIIPISSASNIDSTKEILDDFITRLYLNPLKRLGIHFSNDIDDISLTSISSGIQESGPVEGYLACLRIMIHARDLLIFYGIASMLTYFENIETGHSSPLKSRIKRQISECSNFKQALSDLKKLSQLSGFVSHPKMKFLSNILEKHFYEGTPDSKVIIFSNYRECVFEISKYLGSFSTRFRAAPLLGLSGSDTSTKYKKINQQNTIESFIRGDLNILVSTCIGEEGLDIGYVDLIIFYDAHSSPIRLVQRSGRTGRNRDGKVIILVSERRERNLFECSEASLKNIENALSNSKNRFKFECGAKNPMAAIKAPLQVVKFKMALMDSENSKSSLKRNLYFTPHILTTVPDFNIKNSIVDKFGSCHSIQHSTSSSALVSVMSSFIKKEKDHTDVAKCQAVWKAGIKSMPIFKPFNYTPNSLEKYSYFYSALFKTSDNVKMYENLPDDFFAQEDFESSLKDIFSFDSNVISEDLLIDDSFDKSDLEALDWSDSGF